MVVLTSTSTAVKTEMEEQLCFSWCKRCQGIDNLDSRQRLIVGTFHFTRLFWVCANSSISIVVEIEPIVLNVLPTSQSLPILELLLKGLDDFLLIVIFVFKSSFRWLWLWWIQWKLLDVPTVPSGTCHE